jgi:hypothetical protein
MSVWRENIATVDVGAKEGLKRRRAMSPLSGTCSTKLESLSGLRNAIRLFFTGNVPT